tara:strand:- start:12082 stop:12456 length:375 start_codon:yes stop_codon:yes gene_type:complete
MNPMLLATAVGSVSLNALAQIALRKTMLSIGPLPSGIAALPSFGFSLATNAWFIAGMACYVVSIGIWMIVLGKVEVSVAYPLLSIGYVITAIIGYFYLGEDVNALRIAGIALICCGIVVISRSV